MADVIQLPEQWDDVTANRNLLDEGEYTVRVREIAEQFEYRIVATLEILDKGPCQGRLLHDWFHLDTNAGMRLLKELTEAIGVNTSNRYINTAQCIGNVLRVTVRHREGKDGKVYVNVVRHTPAEQAR